MPEKKSFWSKIWTVIKRILLLVAVDEMQKESQPRPDESPLPKVDSPKAKGGDE